MAWCLQATSHYLSQCWPKSMSPYGVTTPQWVMEEIYCIIEGSQYSMICLISHDDVIKWKHFPRYWPFVRGIHRSSVNSPHKRPVTWTFDVFFDLRLNERLSKQPRGWWFETPSRPSWRHYNVDTAHRLLLAMTKDNYIAHPLTGNDRPNENTECWRSRPAKSQESD